MNNDFLNLKEQQVLYQLKEYLENISVDSTLLESSGIIPVNKLIAVTREMVKVNVLYHPLPEDHFTEIRLLQQYTVVIDRVDVGRKSDLLLLINELNNQSPLGSFSINEKGELLFRYIYPVSRFDMIREETFQEIFTLYLNCLMGFRNVIMHVNTGSLSISDALKDVMAA